MSGDPFLELSLAQLLRADIERYVAGSEYDVLDLVRALFSNESMVFAVSFRLCQRIAHIKNGLLRRPLLWTYGGTIHKVLSVVLGIDIHVNATIGRGFYLGHAGSIHIGPTVIGDYCNISQENTIGMGDSAEGYGIPSIGNRVYIGPGAKLFGAISIGDETSIGANAVVAKSIPPRSVVMGNPGRLVRTQDVNSQIPSTLPKRFRLLRART